MSAAGEITALATEWQYRGRKLLAALDALSPHMRMRLNVLLIKRGWSLDEIRKGVLASLNEVDTMRPALIEFANLLHEGEPKHD